MIWFGSSIAFTRCMMSIASAGFEYLLPRTSLEPATLPFGSSHVVFAEV